MKKKLKKKIQVNDEHWKEFHPVSLDRILQYLNNRWAVAIDSASAFRSGHIARYTFRAVSNGRGDWEIYFGGFRLKNWINERVLEMDDSDKGDGLGVHEADALRREQETRILKEIVRDVKAILKDLSKIDF